jgi:hypothetical protein
MALVLKGKEFVVTEALSESILLWLGKLARTRPLVLNGTQFCADDFSRLAIESREKGEPVWPWSPASEGLQ